MAYLSFNRIIILSFIFTFLAGCSKPPELRGYWASQSGGWVHFLNGTNMEITIGGAFTTGRYKFLSSTSIEFRTPFPETCTFKLINKRTFSLTECSSPYHGGVYRYQRARR